MLKRFLYNITIISAIYLAAAFCYCNSNNSSEKATRKKSSNTTFSNNENLLLLGKVWGFLKYYHPAVISGKYNWDEELWSTFSKIQRCNSLNERNEMLADWIETLGKIEADLIVEIDSSKVKAYPDLDWLGETEVLGDGLSAQLLKVKSARRPTSGYYAAFSDIGNPVFKNELPYSDSPFPNEKLRLLALFRYWNMIQYFYPYRYLIRNWNSVLADFIPLFLHAKSKEEYLMVCLQLISCIEDTHATVFGSPTIDSLKGMFICPFQVRYIENRYVVTGYYERSRDVTLKLKIGDVIDSIDGISVDRLVKKYAPYTSASNLETRMKILGSASGFILRSNTKLASLSVIDKNARKKISIRRIPIDKANYKVDWNKDYDYGFSLLDSTIGYIYPAKLKNTDLAEIKRVFKDTKGLIIDLRGYPSVFMPFEFGNWLKPAQSPFATISTNRMAMPGRMVLSNAISNGGWNPDNYKGKVVVITNSNTISQGEYTAMALRTVPGAIVIGSTTAGADGDVSEITLPGGVKTLISGTGIYYPNGEETQRVGIVPDIIVNPTLQGVTEGTDELLEKAVTFLLTKGRQQKQKIE